MKKKRPVKKKPVKNWFGPKRSKKKAKLTHKQIAAKVLASAKKDEAAADAKYVAAELIKRGQIAEAAKHVERVNKYHEDTRTLWQQFKDWWSDWDLNA